MGTGHLFQTTGRGQATHLWTQKGMGSSHHYKFQTLPVGPRTTPSTDSNRRRELPKLVIPPTGHRTCPRWPSKELTALASRNFTSGSQDLPVLSSNGKETSVTRESTSGCWDLPSSPGRFPLLSPSVSVGTCPIFPDL